MDMAEMLYEHNRDALIRLVYQHNPKKTCLEILTACECTEGIRIFTQIRYAMKWIEEHKTHIALVWPKEFDVKPPEHELYVKQESDENPDDIQERPVELSTAYKYIDSGEILEFLEEV